MPVPNSPVSNTSAAKKKGIGFLKHSAVLGVAGALLFAVAVAFSTHSFSIFLAILALGAFAEFLHYAIKGLWYCIFSQRIDRKHLSLATA